MYDKDQYPYLGNCPPTPHLTQQQSIDNKTEYNQMNANINNLTGKIIIIDSQK